MQDFRAFEHAVATWAPELPAESRVPAIEVLQSAECALKSETALRADSWHAFLDHTRSPHFLQALDSSAERTRWANTAFEAIRRSGFTLEMMITQRVRAHGSRVFLREARTSAAWTYEQADRRMRSMAAVSVLRRT